MRSDFIISVISESISKSRLAIIRSSYNGNEHLKAYLGQQIEQKIEQSQFAFSLHCWDVENLNFLARVREEWNWKWKFLLETWEEKGNKAIRLNFLEDIEWMFRKIKMIESLNFIASRFIN